MEQKGSFYQTATTEESEFRSGRSGALPRRAAQRSAEVFFPLARAKRYNEGEAPSVTLVRRITLDYELREHLAVKFADVMRSLREDDWQGFVNEAQQSRLDPYVALARMLVRVVEDATEGKPMALKKKKVRPSPS